MGDARGSLHAPEQVAPQTFGEVKTHGRAGAIDVSKRPRNE
jgi:hypothetical protein